jgi:heptosyltransferase-2
VINAVDMIATAAGVTMTDKTMRYVVTEAEAKEAEAAFPLTEKPRVGIQVQASAKNRSYPFEALMKVGNDLLQEGCEVFLFASPGTVRSDKEFVNLSELKLNFRQSSAVLQTCDAMVTPDSALCHVAGALGIPTVALFGPFPAAIRTAYQKSVFAIDGHAPCAPCHHHDNTGLAWPDGCPGWKTEKCAALANIDPKRVVREVMKRIPPRNVVTL